MARADSALVKQRQICESAETLERVGTSLILSVAPLKQLFKVFRALWVNPDDDSFGENVTVQYFRRYIKDTGAKSTVKYSGDCKRSCSLLKISRPQAERFGYSP